MRECLDLMAAGQWVSGVSHLAIAEKHHVHPDTASRWATAASRVLRLAVEGDIEDIRARMLATLGTIVQRCMDVEQPSVRDHKTAIMAIDTQAKLLGLVVQKHEVAMTPEEAKALVAEAAKLHEGS